MKGKEWVKLIHVELGVACNLMEQKFILKNERVEGISALGLVMGTIRRC